MSLSKLKTVPVVALFLLVAAGAAVGGLSHRAQPGDDGKPDEKAPVKKADPERSDKVDIARAKAALDRMQGAWTEGEGVDLEAVTMKGDRLEWNKQVLKVKIVGFDGDVTLADVVVEEGPGRGETYKAIVCVGTDTVHWCITSDDARPVEFKTVPKGVTRYVAWKPVKDKPSPAK